MIAQRALHGKEETAVVAVAERPAEIGSLDGVVEYLRGCMDAEHANYRDAATQTVQWLMATGQQDMLATFAVSGLMHRAANLLRRRREAIIATADNDAPRPRALPVPAIDDDPPAPDAPPAPPEPGGPLHLEVVEGLDRPLVGRWTDLQFVVSGRTMRLAQMRRFDCLEKANFYRSLQESNGVHARFLRAVGERLDGDQRVADVLGDSELARIWRLARSGK